MTLDEIADSMLSTLRKNAGIDCEEKWREAIRGELLADLARYRVAIDRLWTQLHARRTEYKSLTATRVEGLYSSASHRQKIAQAHALVIEGEKALGLR